MNRTSHASPDSHSPDFPHTDSLLCPDSQGAVSDISSRSGRHGRNKSLRTVLRRFASRLDSDVPTERGLEGLLDTQVDPLVQLRGLSTRRKAQLRSILTSEMEYALMVERIAEVLGVIAGRWDELELASAGSRDPLKTASAFLVLHWVVRQDALTVIRDHSVNQGRLELETCPTCPLDHRFAGQALEIARQALPPYRLGCTCRIVPVVSIRTTVPHSPEAVHRVMDRSATA